MVVAGELFHAFAICCDNR